MASPDFPATFEALKSVLEPFETALVKVHDTLDHYYLDTAHIQKNKKPLYFGSVRTGSRYVSFHLMPVYVFPELLDDLSDGLRSRMQGKSCFNFTTPDPTMLAELEQLTKRGFERFREGGFVE